MKHLSLIALILVLICALDLGYAGVVGHSLLGQVFKSNILRIVNIVFGCSSVYLIFTRFIAKKSL